ncbi:hypothetical protein BHE90_014512 [Fusarium euwallaceae]|uniref:Uncharacterized protein n=2 Tax=Fusarium solani species complex TaxID=232080 RepID=A0A430L5V3_9HYPO|nr:hypothetical protein CEP51_014979 [Fusarium floridanum]RTE71088.1 hypothetical protein BHE90_014512 [Fusarium euwallaceae]
MAPTNATPGPDQDEARSAAGPHRVLRPVAPGPPVMGTRPLGESTEIERRQELTTAAYATIIKRYDTPTHVSNSFAQHIIPSFPSGDQSLVLRGIVIETPKVNAGCREAKTLLSKEEKTQTMNLTKRQRTDELARMSSERLDTAWGGRNWLPQDVRDAYVSMGPTGDVPQMVVNQMSRITTILEPKGRRFLHSLWEPDGLLREMVKAGKRAPYFSGDQATEALKRVKQTWGEPSRGGAEEVDGQGIYNQPLESQVTLSPSANWGTNGATNDADDATEEEATLELGRGDLSRLAPNELSDNIDNAPSPTISDSRIQLEAITTLQLPVDTEIVDMASPDRPTVQQDMAIVPDITDQEVSDHQLLGKDHFSCSGPSDTSTSQPPMIATPRGLRDAITILTDQSRVPAQRVTKSPDDTVSSSRGVICASKPNLKRKRDIKTEGLVDLDRESLSNRGSSPIHLDSAQVSQKILRQLTTEESLTDDVLDLCCRAILYRYDKSQSMLLLHPLWFFDDAHSDTLPSEVRRLQHAEVVCFPIHHNGHWSLGVLKRSEGGFLFQHHDSSPSTKRNELVIRRIRD